MGEASSPCVYPWVVTPRTHALREWPSLGVQPLELDARTLVLAQQVNRPLCPRDLYVDHYTATYTQHPRSPHSSPYTTNNALCKRVGYETVERRVLGPLELNYQ